MKQTTDFTALITRARNGDHDAMAQLYEQTYPAVYAALSTMLPQEADVLDCAQETYIKAFTTLSQLKQSASFPAWVRRIAVNEARDLLKKRKALTFSDLGEDGDAPPRLDRGNPFRRQALEITDAERLRRGTDIDELVDDAAPLRR